MNEGKHSANPSALVGPRWGLLEFLHGIDVADVDDLPGRVKSSDRDIDFPADFCERGGLIGEREWTDASVPRSTASSRSWSLS